MEFSDSDVDIETEFIDISTERRILIDRVSQIDNFSKSIKNIMIIVTHQKNTEGVEETILTDPKNLIDNTIDEVYRTELKSTLIEIIHKSKDNNTTRAYYRNLE